MTFVPNAAVRDAAHTLAHAKDAYYGLGVDERIDEYFVALWSAIGAQVEAERNDAWLLRDRLWCAAIIDEGPEAVQRVTSRAIALRADISQSNYLDSPTMRAALKAEVDAEIRRRIDALTTDDTQHLAGFLFEGTERFKVRLAHSLGVSPSPEPTDGR